MKVSLSGGGTSKLTVGGGKAREAWLVSSAAETGRVIETRAERITTNRGRLFTNYILTIFSFYAAKLDRGELRQTRTKTVTEERTFIGYTSVELYSVLERGTSDHARLFLFSVIVLANPRWRWGAWHVPWNARSWPLGVGFATTGPTKRPR
jgi:hypothetical protein